MADFKGTPAPWRVEAGGLLVLKGEDTIVAGAWGNVPEGEWPHVGIANARLIAAAPDLLEALGCLLPVLKIADTRWSQNAEFQQAEAAIAKALGES